MALEPPTRADLQREPADVRRGRIRRVHEAIVADEARWRQRLPWLRHQDALGMGIWLGSLGVVIALAFGYLVGALPWWLVLPSSAIALSLLHELEHDLIHDLYFRARRRVQDLMFAGIWVAKLSLDPWTRRGLHLHHHRRSGQPDDVEERFIGNGAGPLWLRLLLGVLPIATVVLVPELRRVEAAGPVLRAMRGKPGSWQRRRAHVSSLFLLTPLVLVLVWVGVAALGSDEALASLPMRLLQTALVAWVLPGIVRHAAIVWLSSFSHYYGDIEAGDLFRQNQVLRHPLLWPLQLFAFNFGATHAIHHYVVKQPFYLRQLVAPAAFAAMRAEGTRFDDFGAIGRRQRWSGA